MATRRRAPVVPVLDTNSAPESAADETGDVEIFDGPDIPGLSLYRESGDMAALSDANFGDWEWWVYRIRSTAEMQELRTKEARVLVLKLTGPLDVVELMRACGGGVFEIRGFFNHIMRTRIRREFAGPIKTYGTEPVQTQSVTAKVNAAPAPAAPNSEMAMMRRMIRRQNRVLEGLTGLVQSRLATPAPAVVDPMAQLTAVLEIADRIHDKTNPKPEANVLGEVVNAFRSGMELRKEIDGEPEKSPTELVIDKGLPMVERLLGTFLANRRAPARPVPPAPPHPPSGAQVVDSPPPPSSPPKPAAAVESGEHRWTTAIEAMARAMSEGEDAGEFAITLEAILQPAEIWLVRNASTEQVVATLRERAGGAFPVFGTDAAAAYIAAVKAALEDDSDDDGGDDGSGVPGM